jgi:flagellar basal body-associated protein FliL
MNPNTTPVPEPDFEGEAMKIPQTYEAPEVVAEPTSVVNAPIIILLITILLALLGGIYYWYLMLMSAPAEAPTATRPTAAQNNEPESTTVEARTAATDVVSTSDELDAIAADVQSTSFEDVDTDVNNVQVNLDSALQASTTGQ